MNATINVLPCPAPGPSRGIRADTSAQSSQGDSPDFADVLGQAVQTGEPPVDASDAREHTEPVAADASHLDTSQPGAAQPGAAEHTDAPIEQPPREADEMTRRPPLSDLRAVDVAVVIAAGAPAAVPPAPPSGADAPGLTATDALVVEASGTESALGTRPDTQPPVATQPAASSLAEEPSPTEPLTVPSIEPPAPSPADAEPNRPTAGSDAPDRIHLPTTVGSVDAPASESGDAPAAEPVAGKTPVTAPLRHDAMEISRGALQRIGSSRLGLDVSTEHLGTVRIEAVDRRGDLELSLRTENLASRLVLTERLPELREQLRIDGVQIARLDVAPGHDHSHGQRGAAQHARGEATTSAAPTTATPAPSHPTEPTNSDAPPSPVAADGRVDVRL